MAERGFFLLCELNVNLQIEAASDSPENDPDTSIQVIIICIRWQMGMILGLLARRENHTFVPLGNGCYFLITRGLYLCQVVCEGREPQYFWWCHVRWSLWRIKINSKREWCWCSPSCIYMHNLKCEISFVLRGKKKCILQNFTEIYTYIFKPQALFFFFAWRIEGKKLLMFSRILSPPEAHSILTH